MGFAHIDVHTVRSKSEALMVVIGPDGVVQEVRVLAFHEPLDYLPALRWYTRLGGLTAADEIRVGRDIDAVSGATLSTAAASSSVRRALALYQVLGRDQRAQRGEEGGKEE